MRALLSVSDPTGLTDLASGLRELGFELVASGGTADALSAAGLPVTRVEDVTGFPEILRGRVKTLHPSIHGGLLADRDDPSQHADLARHGIEPFDLVVSNLYPFRDRPDVETIDIGGPTIVRAAAKNHAWVAVVTDPSQYGPVLEELQAHGGRLTDATRRRLALDAFAHTAAYDASIVEWLQSDERLPRHLVVALERTDDELRYGENPHQRAARYRERGTESWWDGVVQHGGLALSYLNYYDAEAAWLLAHDLGHRPAVAIVKHANPCGVAVADDITTAYARALEGDELSAFGGIVALNREVDDATARRMAAGPQADVVVAPAYGSGALEVLRAKRRNTRLLEAPPPTSRTRDFRQLSGGFLVQDPPRFRAGQADWRVVTRVQPTEQQWRDAELAWRVCGHVKSNSVVLVKDEQAVGIGAGQQSRVGAGELAARKADGRAKGGASATDGFYPFPDGIEAAAAAGVAVVIQPGGSVRDAENVARADELGLAMVFTGERHFLH